MARILPRSLLKIPLISIADLGIGGFSVGPPDRAFTVFNFETGANPENPDKEKKED